MSRPVSIVCGLVILTLAVAPGCRPQQPFYFFEDGDLSHYIDKATEIEYPDAEVQRLDDVSGTLPPLTLENSKPESIWDLTLEEAVCITLSNGKVLRTLGAQVTSLPDLLLRMPDQMPTIYDPALRESDPIYGVEAALAAFDAQLLTSVFWEKNDTPENWFQSTLFPDLDTLRQDVGSFQAELRKTSAEGTTWSLRHNVYYDMENMPRPFISDWNVNLEAEFRHPLLQGSGVQFNRIAGPSAIPGINRGVMIARLNTDIALTDFEGQVRNTVNDVERAYWELYLAYRRLDSVIAGRDSALQTWRKIHSLYVVGGRGGEADKEAQARQQYFLFRSQVEAGLSNLYAMESNLRYIMGLTATDGRLIRPADEPTAGKVNFDWCEILAEGLARDVILRRQKWVVKKAELELIAAKNYLLPRLDAVGRYRWLGLGDDLINPTPQAAYRDNAYQELTSGRYQEWHLGLDLTLPIGFRKEMSGVRYAQLELARERTLFQEQELELSHQLSGAIRELDRGFVLTRTNFNHRAAAQREVEAVAAAYETETVTLDLLLNAQRRLAEAEIVYYESLIGYNLAIAQVHFRKGSLLEYNGVYLAEGPWPGKAYFDARRRARARDASAYFDYGFTMPKVISRGVYDQQAGQEANVFDMEGMPQPDASPMEMIPTPAPEPTEAPTPTKAPEEPLPPEADGARNEGVKVKGPILQVAQEAAVTAPSQTGSATLRWKAVQQAGGQYETVSAPTTAEADRSASSWKRIQR